MILNPMIQSGGECGVWKEVTLQELLDIYYDNGGIITGFALISNSDVLISTGGQVTIPFGVLTLNDNAQHEFVYANFYADPSMTEYTYGFLLNLEHIMIKPMESDELVAEINFAELYEEFAPGWSARYFVLNT